MIFYLLDLVGTFAFSLTGAQYAFQHRLAIPGIVAIASLTAVGGGTIRELFLHHTPFYFYDYLYLLAILAGIFTACLPSTRRQVFAPIVLAAEWLGTIIFAFIGARAAVQADLGLPAIVLFACLTAFGGGLLSDVLLRQKPRIFYTALSVIPCLLLGVTCWFFKDNLQNALVAGLLLFGAYILQLGIGAWPQVKRGCSIILNVIWNPQTKSIFPGNRK